MIRTVEAVSQADNDLCFRKGARFSAAGFLHSFFFLQRRLLSNEHEQVTQDLQFRLGQCLTLHKCRQYHFTSSCV